MISATVLTKNCAATLGETLASLTTFPEVIILDSGSTDGTLEVAAHFPNVKIFKSFFDGFGPMHNRATSLASHDWILSVDSDEVLSDDLIEEIHALTLSPDSVYLIERDNYFNGKRIRGCSGWYPDCVVRLYNRRKTKFSNASIHEKVESNGLKVVSLKHPIRHTPYRGMHDFLAKMQVYSTLFAEQNRGKKESSFLKALLHGSFAFLRSYVVRRGLLAGKEGFIISAYIGQTAFYKYLKLAELNQEK